MKTTNKTSAGSKAVERVKLWDGTPLFEKYKDWLYELKEATVVLASPMSDISEFAQPLTLAELVRMQRSPTDYFSQLERKALDWVNEQRPIQRQYLAEEADRLLTIFRQAFQEWQSVFHRVPQIEGRHVPKRLLDINNLPGLFEGFSDDWLESLRDEFNEYADSPEQIALLNAMRTLADAANNMAGFSRHWAHKTNPLAAFCKYDNQAEKFVPALEGITSYVSVYTPTPVPVAKLDEAIIARERIRNILFGKTGFAANTDAELLAADFFGDDEQSKAAKKYQETLKKNTQHE